MRAGVKRVFVGKVLVRTGKLSHSAGERPRWISLGGDQTNKDCSAKNQTLHE